MGLAFWVDPLCKTACASSPGRRPTALRVSSLNGQWVHPGSPGIGSLADGVRSGIQSVAAIGQPPCPGRGRSGSSERMMAPPQARRPHAHDPEERPGRVAAFAHPVELVGGVIGIVLVEVARLLGPSGKANLEWSSRHRARASTTIGGRGDPGHGRPQEIVNVTEGGIGL